MSNMHKQVIIIGGGASGMTAAIAAAKNGASVTILEHKDCLGKKILATGNGKCNLTNLNMTSDCFRCSQNDFPGKILNCFNEQDTIRFFERIGIPLKNRNGYLYPNSEQAVSVRDALVMSLKERNVNIQLSCQIRSAVKKGNKFVVETNQGLFTCDSLILSTGSKAAPVTGSDGSGYILVRSFGHKIIEPLPALVQLRSSESYFKKLAGIRVEAKITILVDDRKAGSDQGELQLTDYGISGIPTFQISRYASVALYQKKKVTVFIDFLPNIPADQCSEWFMNRIRQFGSSRDAIGVLNGVLNQKLTRVLLSLAGIDEHEPVKHIKQQQWLQFIDKIKQLPVVINGTNSFEQAQICCGGADTLQLNPATMESKLVSGLYLTGELIDVDGICGGYNLQWAWSTGMIAGMAAGREKKTDDQNQPVTVETRRKRRTDDQKSSTTSKNSGFTNKTAKNHKTVSGRTQKK